MRIRSTTLTLTLLSFALCGIGRAEPDNDGGHHDNDRGHYNSHHAGDDCDGGDSDDGGHPGNPGSGSSQSNSGGLYIVQGAPGRDLSPAFYPTYPIDVLVNDTACLVQNSPFPTAQGAFVEPAGTYDLKISPANPTSPCTNGFVAETRAVVNTGQATYVVVALSMNSTLTTYTFNAQLPRVLPGSARVILAHAADAGVLDPGATAGPLGGGSLGSIPPSGASPGTPGTLLSAGQSLTLVVPVGPFKASFNYAGTNQVAVGPILDMLQSRSTNFYFIVGSSQTGSLQVISSRVPDVF